VTIAEGVGWVPSSAAYEPGLSSVSVLPPKAGLLSMMIPLSLEGVSGTGTLWSPSGVLYVNSSLETFFTFFALSFFAFFAVLSAFFAMSLPLKGQCHGNSDSFAVRRQLASSDETDIV
jgi:hypothetical protein